MILNGIVVLCNLLGLLSSPLGVVAPADKWIQPENASEPLVWGRTDGIVFGIPSEGGMGGPRGLIRVGLPGKFYSKPELINFIAIEPVILGTDHRNWRIAFSELEMSSLDNGERGKRLSAESVAGEITTQTIDSKVVETLSVRIDVEQFDSGAHVYLIASVQSDNPCELHLEVHTFPDSAPLDELTVSATMGNYERLRWLWLKDQVVDSRQIYAGYRGKNFVEHESYPLEKMLSDNGDALAVATPNEWDPASVKVAEKTHWTYRSERLTQYWRVPAEDIQDNLRVRVNGRRVYWLSNMEIPGGPAYENFEVRQKYQSGQEFIFGLTRLQPWEWNPGIDGVKKRIPEGFGSSSN